jgi:GT2 family glycosyltransferase
METFFEKLQFELLQIILHRTKLPNTLKKIKKKILHSIRFISFFGSCLRQHFCIYFVNFLPGTQPREVSWLQRPLMKLFFHFTFDGLRQSI